MLGRQRGGPWCLAGQKKTQAVCIQPGFLVRSAPERVTKPLTAGVVCPHDRRLRVPGVMETSWFDGQNVLMWTS